MGASDSFHFAWLMGVIEKNKGSILRVSPAQVTVVGLGENTPSPVAKDLFKHSNVEFVLFDNFPSSSEVNALDLNRLSFPESLKADYVFILRCSYFILNKQAFFDGLKPLLKKGSVVFIDFLIGSSRFPVLRFEYKKRKNHAEYSREPAYFRSSFFDEAIEKNFSHELKLFSAHARWWPIGSALEYWRRYGSQLLSEWGSQRKVNPFTFGSYMRQWFAVQNLFTLADFRRNGFEIVDFSTKYFYPQVGKFHLYSFVMASYRGEE